jgi:hypothetical protein
LPFVDWDPRRVFHLGLWQGIFSQSLVGVLASLTEALAQEEISILAISTFDTDYLLVKEAQVDKAVQKLSQAGHRFV